MKVLFIFAHPDDETFSSGGTIAKLTRSGHTVKLITATRGEVGAVGDPPITTKNKLGATREKELRNAAKILGVSKIHFLGFIDGTLHKLRKLALERSITQVLNMEEPDIVITFDKNGSSNHPDHKAVAKATTSAYHKYAKAVRKLVKLYNTATPKSYLNRFQDSDLGYNIYGKQKGIKDNLITTRVEIDFKIKEKALRQHKTQHKDWEKYLKRKKIVNLGVEFFQLVHEKGFV